MNTSVTWKKDLKKKYTNIHALTDRGHKKLSDLHSSIRRCIYENFEIFIQIYESLCVLQKKYILATCDYIFFFGIPFTTEGNH